MNNLKIIVIGNSNVGKTSIGRKFVEGEFSSNYNLTIGVEF